MPATLGSSSLALFYPSGGIASIWEGRVGWYGDPARLHSEKWGV